MRAQEEYRIEVFPTTATLSFTSTLAAITAPETLLPVPDILSPPRTMTAPSNVKLPAMFRSPSTRDRKSTRLNSSHGYISYAVFCLKKKKKHSLDEQKRDTI